MLISEAPRAYFGSASRLFWKRLALIGIAARRVSDTPVELLFLSLMADKIGASLVARSTE